MHLRLAWLCVAAVAALPLRTIHSQDTARTRPQKLETVTIQDSADFVSVRLAGFERRLLLKQGSVSFFTGDEIVKRGTIRLTDALRRAHGVSIVDSDNGDKLVASSRTQLPSGGGFIVRGIAKRKPSDAAPAAPRQARAHWRSASCLSRSTVT